MDKAAKRRASHGPHARLGHDGCVAPVAPVKGDELERQEAAASCAARVGGDSAASAFAHRNLPLLLLQARERVLADFRPLLTEQGLTEQQWRIVRELFAVGPLEPREIVSRCSISSPSLAGVLSRMDELGLVQRERLQHDQRRQHVRLTDLGRRLCRRLLPRVEAQYGQLERRLGPARLTALYAAIDDLIARLDDNPDDSTDPL